MTPKLGKRSISDTESTPIFSAERVTKFIIIKATKSIERCIRDILHRSQGFAINIEFH